MIEMAGYCSTLVGRKMAGGAVVCRRKPHEHGLARTCLEPEAQHHGLGKQAGNCFCASIRWHSGRWIRLSGISVRIMS